VPLYLEWSPEDVFVNGGAAPVAADETAGGSTSSTAPAGTTEDDDNNEEPQGVLFVKNLAFATTDDGLKKAFKNCKGLRSALVMRKKAPVEKDGSKPKADAKGLSMGYGFLEFATAADAAEALRSRQGTMVDGHAVQLQLSQRGSKGGRSEGAAGQKAKGAINSSSICVRNLAFEATRKELYQLFGAYGSVTSVRIPKKSDYSGHRGFAFIDFASRSEAAAAFEALQHTHLYGRRLVIEPAEEKATDVGSVQAEAAKRKDSLTQTSEAKKRRKAGILNAPGEAGSFEEAFMS
ncbi:unnamed protein product, partial [Polarella glacialis]